MKILLCSVPDGSLEDSLKSFSNFSGPIRPIGITRLIDWMETKGYSGDIYDINNLRPSDDEITKIFKKINPTIVGLSATLTHCYPNVKRIAKLLRQLFPDIWIVVGGHITSSANVILKRTETDICIVGDGEIPWVKFLDYVKLNPKNHQLDYTELGKIKGLAYYDSNDVLNVSYGEQLPASELKHTDYEKLRAGLFEKSDMVYDYFPKLKDHSTYKEPLFKKSKFYQRPNQTVATIDTSKGCVARCTFCQRYTKGYRTYAAHDLEAHILYLKENFNVTGLDINDENFGSDKKKAYEFARIMKKCDVFWRAGGVRCTSVTYEDMKFYKEHNLVFIKFGIESGSQKMLDIMEKKFKKEDVYNAIVNCHKTGVTTEPDAVLVGMPGETNDTITESARFMASLRFVLDFDWNTLEPAFWAMPIPGTPLYDYCQQVGLIGTTLDEEEDFLNRTSELKANFLNYINMTDLSVKRIHYWNYLFEYEGKSEYVRLIFKNNKSLISSLKKVYEKCIKCQYGLIVDYLKIFKKKWTAKSEHGFKYKSRIKFYSWCLAFIAANIFNTLNVLLMPRPIRFAILRVYASLRFRAFEAKYRVKTGKQKFNIFMERNIDLASNLRVTDKRISKTNRQIERSLRGITLANVKQNKSSLTENEKGLRVLAEGQ